MDNATWASNLAADKGAPQILYVKELFEARKWWQLVPDKAHAVVTSGFGTCRASTGTRMFTPPTATHSDGYSDWALVLETSPP